MILCNFITRNAIELAKNRNYKKLLERLKNSEIRLSDSQIKSNALLSSFVNTQEAIDKAESQEKFDFLLSLYIDNLKSESFFDNADLYNETIKALGDMTCREITFVYLLDDYLRKNKEEENKFIEFNDGIEDMFYEKLKLDHGSLEAMTRRLYRTGFVSSVTTIDGGIWPRLTPLYKGVLDFIHQEWNRSGFNSDKL